MSTHIIGIKPPDEKWKKMKKVWDACQAAGLDVPDPVAEFFGDEEPDAKGVVVDLDEAVGVEPVTEEGQNVFEVDLAKLAPDIKIIRFWNAY